MAWLRQHLGLAARDRRPGGVPRLAAVRDRRQGGLRLHAQGRVIGLPAGATPVDFAYAVHTEVGHRTMGAKVNGRLVPLESTLTSGDVVEVFTSKTADAGPSQDWLDFVKSPRARNKIRQWFTKERRDEAIEQRQGRHRPRDAQAEPAAAEAHEPGVARRGRRASCATTTSRRSTRRSARGTCRAVGDREGRRVAGRRGRRRARTSPRPPAPRAPAPRATATRACRSRGARHPGQARTLLHAGAGRRDRGLRHPRLRGVGAPGRLPQRRSRC